MKTKLQSVLIKLPIGTLPNTLTTKKIQLDSNYDKAVGFTINTNNNLIYSPFFIPATFGLRSDGGVVVDDTLLDHFQQGFSVPANKSFVPIDISARGRSVTIRIYNIMEALADVYIWVIFKLHKKD